MKVGITGGCGFIGSNLAERLYLKNFEVVVIDDLSTGLKSNLVDIKTIFHNISITNSDLCSRALEDCEVIVHLAARGSVPRSLENPIATHDVNVTGTLNMLEIARKNNLHFIYSSSSSVYGANNAIPKNEKCGWLQSRPMQRVNYQANHMSSLMAILTAYQLQIYGFLMCTVRSRDQTINMQLYCLNGFGMLSMENL